VDDTELVRLARDGDIAALARLLNRHRPRLLAIGTGILGDAEAAAEVAQETALVAVTELDRLREPAYAGAWLAGIARNLCRRRLRSRTYEEWSWESIHGGRVPRDVIDPAPTPEEIVVRNEVVASVAGAVGLLPSGQRDAVRLFYLDELSYREVATTLDIDVNAVKARLHRARRSLQPLVAALSPHPPTIRPEPMMTAAERIDLRVRDVRRRRVEGDEQQVVGGEQHVVTMESEAGDMVPIWVGPSEAIALALRLTGTSTPRPLTYDTMASLVQAADGRITEVCLTRLEGVTYFAEAVVEGGAGTNRVDLRPSDALNLALTVDAPIRITRDLLADIAAVPMAGLYSEDEYPDDASVIAADLHQQWARMHEYFERRRDEA